MSALPVSLQPSIQTLADLSTVHGRLLVLLHPRGLEVQLDGLPVFKSFAPEPEPESAEQHRRGDFLLFNRDGVLLLKRPSGPPCQPEFPPTLRNALLEFVYAQG